MGWTILAIYTLIGFVAGSVKLFQNGGFSTLNVLTFFLFFAPVIVLSLKVIMNGGM